MIPLSWSWPHSKSHTWDESWSQAAILKKLKRKSSFGRNFCSFYQFYALKDSVSAKSFLDISVTSASSYLTASCFMHKNSYWKNFANSISVHQFSLSIITWKYRGTDHFVRVTPINERHQTTNHSVVYLRALLSKSVLALEAASDFSVDLLTRVNHEKIRRK